MALDRQGRMEREEERGSSSLELHPAGFTPLQPRWVPQKKKNSDIPLPWLHGETIISSLQPREGCFNCPWPTAEDDQAFHKQTKVSLARHSPAH